MGTIYTDEVGGVEQQFGIEQAWHGQTQMMAAPFSWFDLQLQNACITWPIDVVPMQSLLVDGVESLPDQQAVVRTAPDGTKRFFKQHGRTYDAGLPQHVVELVDAMRELAGDDISDNMVSALTLHKGRQWAMTWALRERSVNGVKFNAHLMASGSFDGSLAVTVRDTSTVVVCMNTLAIALHGNAAYKFKNTRSVNTRVEEARDALLDEARRALGQTTKAGQAFVDQVLALQSTPCGNMQFERIVANLFPIGEEVPARSRNANETARDQVMGIWRDGQMAEGHDNSAWAAVQAVNTYECWGTPIRKAKGLTEEETRWMRHFEVQTGQADQPLTARTVQLLTV